MMKNKTKHRHTTAEPFDDTAKDFYRQLFEEWGLTVETQREIFFRGRAIDLVVSCPTAEERQCLQATLFAYFRRLNALEFKGINDPLTVLDYNKIMMRAWGLGTVQKKKPKQKSITRENPPETVNTQKQDSLDRYLH
jgi:peroxiredoxin